MYVIKEHIRMELDLRANNSMDSYNEYSNKMFNDVNIDEKFNKNRTFIREILSNIIDGVPVMEETKDSHNQIIKKFPSMEETFEHLDNTSRINNENYDIIKEEFFKNRGYISKIENDLDKLDKLMDEMRQGPRLIIKFNEIDK